MIVPPAIPLSGMARGASAPVARLAGVSDYVRAIAALRPIDWWPLDEPAGATSLRNLMAGRPALTPTNVTFASQGTRQSTAGRFVIASSSRCQSASTCNYTSTNKLTVVAMCRPNAYATAGATLFETDTSVAASNGNVLIALDGGTTGVAAEMLVSDYGNATYNLATYTRPTVGVWHHLAFTFDLSLATNEVNAFTDGVLLTPIARAVNSNNTDSGCSNRTVNVGARNAASLFASMDLQHLSVFPRILSAVEIAELARLAAREFI